MKELTIDELKLISDKLWDLDDKGPPGEGWKSNELEELIERIDLLVDYHTKKQNNKILKRWKKR